jgi:sigma-E factor negative regulatory protein RseA
MDKMANQEIISALADGQLQGEGFARAVEAAAADASAHEAWHTYHLIGEVLRTGACTQASAPSDFLARLRPLLAKESAMLPPQLPADSPSRPATAQAANDTSFRWKVVAGAASLAAIGAIGWSLVAGTGARPGEPQLAAVPAGTVLTQTDRGAMIRDARLDEFMAAHRQLGGASALQMPAGFLRNATFEQPAR